MVLVVSAEVEDGVISGLSSEVLVNQETFSSTEGESTSRGSCPPSWERVWRLAPLSKSA